jgi:hypothetical protein
VSLMAHEHKFNKHAYSFFLIFQISIDKISKYKTNKQANLSRHLDSFILKKKKKKKLIYKRMNVYNIKKNLFI